MKIGIVGLGYVGQLHAKILEGLNLNIEYYVYDTFFDVAFNFAQKHKCKAVTTLEELFDKVDAVIISTPTFTHYNLVMRAIEQGKHILCEKPMTLYIEEAQKLYDEAKMKKIVCTVGFNYRFFDITPILKRKIKVDSITDIHIEIKRLFRKDWHNKENGVLADLGIHLIDYITYICNKNIDLRSCSVYNKYIDDWDYDSTVSGKLTNGILFEINASRIEEEKDVRFAFEIVGKNWKFIYDSRNETSYILEKNNKRKTYFFEKEEKTDGFFDFTDSILRQDVAWIKTITGEKDLNIASFKDGLRAQKALDVFYQKKS